MELVSNSLLHNILKLSFLQRANPKISKFFSGLSLVLFVYFLYYGYILYISDFLPYVMDNNESFSSLVHAFNMFHHKFSVHLGLTDEAFHLSQDAHPVIHTHQGNFPRLFAFIIYALGARTIESQILITTFTIGTLSIIFMYSFFEKSVNKKFSTIVCLIFITDYILFAQWQVNTYRVWHVFFVFSSLLLVESFTLKNKKIMALVAINFMFLMYWEFVFATFVFITSALYCLFKYRENKKTYLAFWILQALGATIAICVLAGQLILFMGWDNFIKDINYTFFSRNFTKDKTELKKILKEFYDGQNIVFFYNMIDGGAYKNISSYITGIFRYGFQISTPYLSFMVVFSFLFLLLEVFTQRIKDISNSQKLQKEMAYALILVLFLGYFFIGFGLALVITAALWFFRYKLLVFLNYRVNEKLAYYILSTFIGLLILSLLGNGVNAKLTTIHTTGNLILGISLGLFIGRFLFRINSFLRLQVSYSVGKVLLISFVLLFAIMFIHNQSGLYDQNLKELWVNQLGVGQEYNSLLWMVGISLFFSLNVKMLNTDTIIKFNNLELRKLTNLIVLLSAFIFAYSVAYVVFPGYMYSGYLTRYASMIVFFVNIIIAAAFYWQLKIFTFFKKIFLLEKSRSKILSNYSNVQIRSENTNSFECGMFILGAGFLLLLMTSQWTYNQYKYIKLLPPKSFTIAKAIKKPRYQGLSSFSNTYSLPFAYQTKAWSYIDHNLGFKELSLDNNRYTLLRSSDYLWFADRKQNDQYRYPGLFICYVNPSLNEVVTKIHNPTNETLCARTVKSYLERNKSTPSIKKNLISEDPSVYRRWAIFELDWGLLKKS